MMGCKPECSRGELQSEAFEVNVGWVVKQGCVLAPVLFNIFLSAITLPLPSVSWGHEDGSVHVEYRLDGSLFIFVDSRPATKTKTRHNL